MEERIHQENLESVKNEVKKCKAARKKIVVEFSVEDHATLKEFVTARETTISRVFRTIWREFRTEWQDKHGWPPKPIDSMKELVL